MYKGSCLCGKVQFEINGTIGSIIFCHCSLCRKAQGSAFGANGFVNRKDFHFICGEDNLSHFESSPGKHRLFCKTCGSPVVSKNNNDSERVRIRLGTLDSDIVEKPIGHTFAGSKANWFEICGELPQYEKYEPGREKN